jgi:hypothetical protein
MRIYKSLMTAAAATFVVAATASAAPRDAMNDSTYLAVAKCAGLAEGVGQDASVFNKVLDAQSGGRISDVIDRADQARRDAKREAAHAGEDGKGFYERQITGACQRYVAAG